MARAEKEIVIDRPIDEVYNFVVDGSNNKKWRSSVLQATIQSGKPGERGAVYRQMVKGPGGKPIQADYTISRMEKNVRMTYTIVAGPTRPEGHFFFQKADGGTRVIYIVEAPLKGWKKLLYDSKLNAAMKADVESLFTLKRVLESDSAK